jgi:soluble lytic murein transglycosylase-like protein
MGREEQRRIALLAIVGVVVAGWVIALKSTSAVATPVARAAPASAFRTTAATPKLQACPFPAPLRGAFESAALDAHISPAMLYAVAKVESNLRENVESEAGARGLLQVLPATARALDLDVDDSHANVLAGARYLRQLLDRFHTPDLALAAYNAGPSAVERAGGAPTLQVETYVANVNMQWHSVAGCR